MNPADFRLRNLERAPFFAEIAGPLQREIPYLKTATYFRSETPLLLAQAYFLLSDSYKSKRRQQTRTDIYKIAAISALSVMVVRPFEPLDPGNVSENAGGFANPIYALACANAWVSDRYILDAYPIDYLRRFYLSLFNVRFPSLTPFIEAANSDADLQSFQAIDLTWQEIELIESWIEKIWHLTTHRM